MEMRDPRLYILSRNQSAISELRQEQERHPRTVREQHTKEMKPSLNRGVSRTRVGNSRDGQWRAITTQVQDPKVCHEL